MKISISVSIISAILMLETETSAQYDTHRVNLLNISLTSSNESLLTLFQRINRSVDSNKIYRLGFYDMDMQNFKTLFQQELQKFRNLKEIFIYGGKMEALPELPDNITIEPQNWTKLIFINVGLENLTKKALKSLQTFRLILSQNNLSSLSEDTFEYHEKLGVLGLSSNKLVDLPNTIFKPLRKLSELYLGENNITELKGDLFSSLQKMEKLDLSFNQIQHIDEKVFSKLNKLTELNMTHALSPNCSKLPPILIENSSNLWSLTMDNNDLRVLPQGIFDYLKKLEILDLSHNKIEHLDPNIFRNNPQLKHLNLEYNLLTNLSGSLFSNLRELKTLNLANNQLNFSIDPHIFMDLSIIETIIIDYNPTDLAFNDTHSVFFQCYNLETISARHTSVSKIFEDWSSLRILKNLDLRGNSVATNILKKNFNFVSKSVDLRLFNENLDLNLTSLISAKRQEQESKWSEVLDKEHNCGDNCSCKFQLAYEVDTIILECTHFDPDKLDKKIPDWIVARSRSMKMEFNLKNCSIKSSSSIAPYLGQVKVTKLSLAFNSLTNIQELVDAEGFENLQVLELDHNKIASLDDKTVDKLRNLRHITLHNNPWNCTCNSDIQSFVKFVDENKKTGKIPDIDQVRCNNNLQVTSFDIDQCTPDTTFFVVFASATVILAIIFCVGTKMYYKYEMTIKVWMYTHQVFPSLVTEKDIDKHKKYDAFISYAKEDETFVATKLVPQLEEGTPRFKLCIHVRNWNPGEPIISQILDSVADSKRTIIILSHNFLKSDWARWEFQAAFMQSMADKCNRILIIMLEDIDKNNLDPAIRAHINERTYIPWKDDPSFWDKLRYTLPHKRIRKRDTRRNHPMLENKYRQNGEYNDTFSTSSRSAQSRVSLHTASHMDTRSFTIVDIPITEVTTTHLMV